VKEVAFYFRIIDDGDPALPLMLSLVC